MILNPPISSFGFFGFSIYCYSVCIFLAASVAFFVMLMTVKFFKPILQKDVLYDMTPWIIISAIVGARLYYVLLCFDYFIQNPFEIFAVWKGGIAIHGAILGGIICAFIYLKKKKLPFLPYIDIYALVFPLGQAIGRWGNFFNSEAFGYPIMSNAPFKLFIDAAHRPEKFINYQYFHPTFLYECVLDLLIFFVLFFIYKKTVNKFNGLVFFSYIILYSLVRIILEFFRLDTVLYFFGIPFPAFVSMIGIIIGIIGLAKVFAKS